MKKVFISIVFAIFMISVISAKDGFFWAGDIPFFKSIFIGDEEYVKQEILKCKDVEAVEMKVSYQDEDDLFYEIHVYLTNHRFLSFDWVDLSFYKSSQTNTRDYITLKQINDLIFEQQSFKPYALGKTGFVYHDWRDFGEIRFLKQLLPDVKVGNILEIIENIDDVYDFIKNLPEKPECISSKETEFDGFYEKSFELPKEFDNGIPVSIIERKTDYASGKWYEKGYKFYKKPVERAINEGTIKDAYKDYKTDY